MTEYDDATKQKIANAIQQQGSEKPTPVVASVAMGGATAASVAALVDKQVG